MRSLIATHSLRVLFLLAASLLVVAPAPADVYTWINDANGNWSVAGNWSSTPGDYPNSDTADAVFSYDYTADRTITLTENITVNALRFTDTGSGTDARLVITPSSGYTLYFAGDTPTIESGSATGGGYGVQINPPINFGTAGLTKTGYGTARFANTITGSGTLTVSQGTLELVGSSTGFTGEIVINSGAVLQGRNYSDGSSVFGTSTAGTSIYGTGQIMSRDVTSRTITEPIALYGIRSDGSIKCYAGGEITLAGAVTLHADSSFGIADWSNNGIGTKRNFYITGGIADAAGESHSVYFISDLYGGSARGIKGRFSEIFVGGTNTYGGNTYLTSNYADDGTETILANLHLSADNALPTGTTLVIGGQFVSNGVYLGTGAGSGKFALGGYDQELAGLTTNGTGGLNMVVGASSDLSTLTLNIATGTTNTYAGYLGYADYVTPTATDDPLYGAPSELYRDNLALVKTGGGTLVLANDNTYSGGTTAADGILSITSAGALGSGAVTVQSGADIRFNATGSYSIDNPMTLAGSGDSGHGAITSTSPGTDVTLTGAITLTGSTVVKTWGDGTTSITLSGGVDGTAGNYGLTLFRDGGQIYIDTNPVLLGTGTLGGGFDLNVAGNTASRLFSQWNQAVNIGVDNPFVTAPAVELGNDSGTNGYRGYLNLQGHTFTASRLAETSVNAVGTSEVRDTVGGGTFILENASGQTSTYTGKFTGDLSLTKTGAGTLILSGDSTYTGATLVQEGVLRITSATALGDTSAGTTVETVGATLQVAGGITVAEPITLGGTSSGTRLQNISDTNTLSGLLTFSGSARVVASSGTTLNITGGATTATNPSFVVNAYGTVNITDNPIDLNGGTFYTDSSGLTILAVTGNTWNNTTLASGTLQMGVANALPSNTSFRHSGLSYGTGGTLDLNGFDQTVASLYTGPDLTHATGSQITSATPATLTVNQSSNTTFSGAFTGAVSLVKDGAGTLTLDGDSTHTGATIVSGGTLALVTTGTNNIANSAEIIVGDTAANSGAVLDVTGVAGGFELGAAQTLSGFGTVLGDLTVLGTHGPGASTGVQVIEGNYTNTGVLEIEIGGTSAGSGYDQILVTGSSDYDVTLGGTLEVLLGSSGWSGSQNNLWIINNETTDGDLIGTFSNFPDNGTPIGSYDGRTWYLYYEADFDSGSFTGGNDVLLTAVPEPSTVAMLLGLAGIGLLSYVRRRRR